MNRRTNRGKALFKGVSTTAKGKYGKFRARITFDGAVRTLGSFDTAEQAALAYDRAARELFGEFACLNFPLDGERQA